MVVSSGCLEDQGLTLEVTDGGELRVDKDKAAEFGYAKQQVAEFGYAKQQVAEAKCRSKLPDDGPWASGPAAPPVAAHRTLPTGPA